MTSPICLKCAASAVHGAASARASCLAPPTSRWNTSGWTAHHAVRPVSSIRARRCGAPTPATYHLDLASQQVPALFVSVACNKPAALKPAPFFRGLLAHRREMRRSTLGATSIETSNDIFNEVLCQSMADLNMLMTDTPQGRYPYAGIPWYSTTFGRDGLITALQMLWIDPRIARGVLKRLALS